MKYALLGGSFNPIHVGHLALADAVLSGAGCDRVILAPAFQSPFKSGADCAPPAARLAMVCAACAGDSRLAVDDCELRREGVSYTIDTAADLAERWQPEGKLALVIGSDLAAGFGQWKDAALLAERTDIIIAARPGAPLGAFPYPHRVLEGALPDVSSSMVRERIAGGGAWRGLVPPGARDIIEREGLYGRAAAPWPDAALVTLVEDYARQVLSAKRFLHSRNTALLCAELCAAAGLAPARGYLAGIAHDICKGLPLSEQEALAKRDAAEEGERLSSLERTHSSLLHARAAAALLRERFGVRDDGLLAALRSHTICAAEMSPLAMIVYTADKVEPAREHVSAALRRLCRDAAAGRASIDALFAAALRDAARFLGEKGMDVSPSAKRLLSKLG
ncbi:MAG: nicotinate (nicotinamide) nucleotide adenylyltransferase [Treponema sp.]|jgi:nicotinate-nucleotide adenylyltransferase|nr:nicotinate (nicotinamide) nucleotide adenylyltransferase [Treponema sp.]